MFVCLCVCLCVCVCVCVCRSRSSKICVCLNNWASWVPYYEPYAAGKDEGCSHEWGLQAKMRAAVTNGGCRQR